MAKDALGQDPKDYKRDPQPAVPAIPQKENPQPVVPPPPEKK